MSVISPTPLPLQCDADPDVVKAVVQEDKYENVLNVISYYQIVSGSVIVAAGIPSACTIQHTPHLQELELAVFMRWGYRLCPRPL